MPLRHQGPSARQRAVAALLQGQTSRLRSQGYRWSWWSLPCDEPNKTVAIDHSDLLILETFGETSGKNLGPRFLHCILCPASVCGLLELLEYLATFKLRGASVSLRTQSAKTFYPPKECVYPVVSWNEVLKWWSNATNLCCRC